MRDMENAMFLRQELDRAKRDLFNVSNVRELKMIQDRISFLSQRLRTKNGSNDK